MAKGEVVVQAMTQESAEACAEDICRLLLGPLRVDDDSGDENAGGEEGGGK